MASSECNGNAGGFLMSNTRLLQAAMPAERMRGAKFCEDFRDHLSMIKGGWTLTAAPLFAKNGGLVLNGTTQYASIPLGNELASTTFTIHMEFIPAHAFQASDCVLDSSATNRLFFGDGGGGSFYILVGGSTCHTATFATWNAALLVGKRNVVTITKLAGAQAIVWLNGVVIANSWGVGTPSGLATTPLLIGKNYAAAIYYPATFSRILIGQYLCTLAEHQAYYNRTMWNWEDRCLVNLQMRTGDYDPTAVRTLDSSGHDLHATLGNGATPSTYPTQSKGCMVFDGGDSLSCGDATALRLTNTGTVLVTFSVTSWAGFRVLVSKNQWSISRNGFSLYVYMTTGAIQGEVGNGATYNGVLSTFIPDRGRWHTAALTWDGSRLKLYINGSIQADTAQTINALSDGWVYRVGSSAEGVASYAHLGSIADNKVLKEALNSTQVADYTIKMLSTLGAQQ